MDMISSLKYAAKSLGNIHFQGSRRNIFLFATARGGSTWLMEILASQPGMKYYDEPLNIRRKNVQCTGLFSSWQDLMPGARMDQQVLDYLNALAKNRYRFMNPPPLRKHHRFITTRIIFKIHEVEHLMDAVAEQCDGQVVYLLRHPIATTLSRAVFPRLEQFVHSEYYRTQILSREQVREIDSLWRLGSGLQKGTMCWCFENLLPLRKLKDNDWVATSYEELLLNAERTCRMLARRLDLTDLPRLLSAVGEPSANIQMSHDDTLQIMQCQDNTERRRRLVTKWKARVSDQDEESAFDVLALFQLDPYEPGRFTPTQKYLHFPDTPQALTSRVCLSDHERERSSSVG